MNNIEDIKASSREIANGHRLHICHAKQIVATGGTGGKCLGLNLRNCNKPQKLKYCCDVIALHRA